MIEISYSTLLFIIQIIMFIVHIIFTVTLLIVLKKKSGATVSEAVKEAGATVGAFFNKIGITDIITLCSSVKDIKALFTNPTEKSETENKDNG